MEKRKYNLVEGKVMRLLFQTRVPMTAYQVAKELKISVPTATKYIELLLKEGVIKEDGRKTKKT